MDHVSANFIINSNCDASTIENCHNNIEKESDVRIEEYGTNVPRVETYLNDMTKVNSRVYKNCKWLMHYNIQGLRSLGKVEEFNQLLTKLDLNVICLNEHWLNENELCLLQNNIQNYTLADFYCRKESRRGGSCILIKDNIQFKPRRDLIGRLEEDLVFEACCAEFVDPHQTSHIVVSLYHNTDTVNMNLFLIKLEILLCRLKKESKYKSKNIYIASDLNIDCQKNCRNPRLKNMLFNLLETNGFNMNFDLPTRIANDSKTCIDNIISNKLVSQRYLINLELGMSDHRALLITLYENTEKLLCSKSVTKRCFTKSSLLNFTQYVKEIKNWNFNHTNSSQQNFDSFFSLFKLHFEQYFPKKTLKLNNSKQTTYLNKSWVTTGIAISSRKKENFTGYLKHLGIAIF